MANDLFIGFSDYKLSVDHLNEMLHVIQRQEYHFLGEAEDRKKFALLVKKAHD